MAPSVSPEAFEEDEAELELQKQLEKGRRLRQLQQLRDSGEKVRPLWGPGLRWLVLPVPVCGGCLLSVVCLSLGWIHLQTVFQVRVRQLWSLGVLGWGSWGAPVLWPGLPHPQLCAQELAPSCYRRLGIQSRPQAVSFSCRS